MIGMRKMTENVKTGIGKRESMERMNRVVGEPITMIEVTRITVLKSQGQAGVSGMRHHIAKIVCQEKKKIQLQSTSQRVCIYDNNYYRLMRKQLNVFMLHEINMIYTKESSLLLNFRISVLVTFYEMRNDCPR